MKVPILLDTDIGSDIDDAVALAYLLAHPMADLVGITTVTGDVQQRAAMCQMLCEAAGRPDIPIHCGLSSAIGKGPGQPNVPQYPAVQDIPHRLDRPENTATAFLSEMIRSRPGELTLLSIGPMGNLARLAQEDPEVLPLLRQTVSMAGKFFPSDWSEWNCRCDPEACATVAAAGYPEHLWVGLDVTLKVKMGPEEVRERFTGPVLAVVERMSGPWFQHSHELTFHDPLAAALIFRPELCQTVSGTLEVELETRPENPGWGGITRFTPADRPLRVCTEVDVPGFFTEYFSHF